MQLRLNPFWMPLPMKNWYLKRMSDKREKICFKKFLPGIAWFFVVAILVFLPKKNVPKVTWITFKHTDKIVHAGLFFILVLLFLLPVLKSSLPAREKAKWIAWIALLGVAWGVSIEYIQKHYITGRSFEDWDIVADSVGICLAIVAGLFLLKRLKK